MGKCRSNAFGNLPRRLLQREAWLLGESQGLLERLLDGRVAPLVSHFSKHRRLSRKDIADLRRLLEELDDGTA